MDNTNHSTHSTKTQLGAAALARFAMRRPVTVCMCFLSLLVFGIIAGRLLPLEKFPGIDIPQMVVQVPYSDATPAEIERMITRPVEEAVASMSGIKRLYANSFEDRAELFVEFAWDENIKAKSIEAREKIDAIRHLLPNDVERILVFKFNTNDMPIFQLRVSSERDLSSAYDLLERNLKRPMERVPGVSKVELYGVLKKHIVIRIDPERVTALNVDVNRLSTTLRDANFAINAGHITDLNQQITLMPQGEFRQLDDIKQLLIRPGVTLGNIATVTYETPPRNEGRHLDRTYAVGFNVFRESGSNLVEVSDSVMKVIDEAKQNPAFNGISLFVMDDVASSVTESLSDLIGAGLIGAALSIAILLVFLRQLSTTLIVVLSVPFSICITLGMMYLFGYTLNILSLMGLMLAVGMLVDNAVVVTESIFQEKRPGVDARIATERGVANVSLAVFAGTATTAIVFLPNIVGVKIDVTVFLEHVAIAICISLFASLIISQTLIPLLASKIKPPQRNLAVSNGLSRYQKILRWTLNNPVKTSLFAVLVLFSTAIPMQYVTQDGDGNNNNERIWLNYHMQTNYTLEEVEMTVNKMEAFLYANQEAFHIKQVYSYFNPGHAVSGITLKDNLPIPVKELKERIRAEMPTFVRAKPSFQWDTNDGGGVRMTMLGESSERLLELSEQIVPILASLPGLTDVKADTGALRQELQIRIDRDKAFRFGLNAQDVANLISTALRGSALRTFRHDPNGEIAIRLMYGEELQSSVANLKALTLRRDGSQQITLDQVATIRVERQLAQINRSYRQTALSIGANLNDNVTLEEAKAQIEKAMQLVELPVGYEWMLGGSFERQDEANAVMQMNMLLAVCMIYVVMAALFESILLPTAVITSLLFSFTGVFWAFFVTGTSMSVMGMIGMLILMGIVVNNGIVLVDRINQLIHEGMTLFDAVLQGCGSRIRPILMTVATTVLGLIPLAIGTTRIGGDGPPYSPMAIAIIGGLLFSTLTSLILIPLTYISLLKMRHKTQTLWRRCQHMVSKRLPA
ncbi:efflux RND transporter permease subunit [Alteromonas oceanisediminis]|uniref:efflux RND transporter permease subunit n=1 Tax=Alteromonas oceanisediminis TaxID=2836180 RepID=UPI001BD96648|nr:efflux RND transporter permease subunit [Alteromonas oceanisediminis]MBT0586415.1 efflux RND transporter permease subunit [Alteromonas oceanisediminis]